ncbi:GerAB/ArcD/ProY family transporter [Paenibacillus sp. strain BS8-2]
MFRVSGIQIFWILCTMDIGMAILLTLTPAITVAKQDAWISFLVGGGLSIVSVYGATRLSLKYPNQTIVEYSRTILGNWAGTIIVIPYFIMWVSTAAIIPRQAAEFIIIEGILPRTPLLYLIISIVLLALYAASGGIEVIGRLSEVLGPIVLMMIVLTILLNVNHINVQAILPVYSDSGWRPILQGGLTPAVFISDSIMMMMLLTFMKEPDKGPSIAALAIAVSTLFMTTSIFVVLGSLDPNIASNMWYPFFEFAKMLSLSDFLQNIDVLIIVIWVASVFIKLSLYLFVVGYGITQWLGTSNWKLTICIIALIVTILAMVPGSIYDVNVVFPKLYAMTVYPLNTFVIPCILWAVSLFRQRAGRLRK